MLGLTSRTSKHRQIGERPLKFRTDPNWLNPSSDRQAIFYRELNKIRKASLSYGCPELLDGIAQLFEHEANSMRKQSDPKKQQGAS